MNFQTDTFTKIAVTFLTTMLIGAFGWVFATASQVAVQNAEINHLKINQTQTVQEIREVRREQREGFAEIMRRMDSGR